MDKKMIRNFIEGIIDPSLFALNQNKKKKKSGKSLNDGHFPNAYELPNNGASSHLKKVDSPKVLGKITLPKERIPVKPKKIIVNIKNTKQELVLLKKTRNVIFNRDKYSCLRCGAKNNLSIDHIIPRSKGGKDDINNLQTLCVKCNQLKADTYIDYRKK